MMMRRTEPTPFRRFLARAFLRGERGATAVEFALVLPIVMLLLLGCFEVPRYILIYQKISRASAAVADLVAQADDPVTGNQIQDIFRSAKVLMQPYDLVANGKVFISSINNTSGSQVVLTWQRPFGKLGVSSRVGVTNAKDDDVHIPLDLKPASGDEVLTGEVFFNYTPIFSTLIYKGTVLYSVSYTRPRNHNLTSTPSAPTAPDPS